VWNKIVFYPVVCLLSVIVLIACKQESISKEMQPSAGQTEHRHSPGKPGASVSLKNSQPLFLSKTGVYEYGIDLLSGFSTGLMTVTVSSNGTIELISTQSQFEFSPDASGEYHIPLKIHVREPGRHYIQLHVSLNETDRVSTRALTAIVQVGESSPKLQKAAQASSKPADGVISLPAQETISSQ